MVQTGEFTIQAATEKDVPLVLTLVKELAAYERLAHEVVATEEMVRRALFSPDRAAEVLLARAGGDPAGFALFYHNFSTFMGRRGLYLEDLFVRPVWRGRGLGRLLLRELARLAAERGCGRMEWAVLDWNEPAIRFYRSLGAEPLTDWRIFRLTDAGIRRLGGGE